MSDAGTIPDGAIYIDSGTIIGVLPADEPAPDGFEEAPHIRTGDTIFPGLIELHNHLCYNAMPLWDVPDHYDNNGQWKSKDTYRMNVSKPTQVLGGTPGVVEALVRYVECRALFGGTTTTQGLRLYTEPGINKYFKGLVRNVEEAGIDELPKAGSKIGNPQRNKAQSYLETMNGFESYLQHISEGIDDTARGWFRNLQIDGDDWAVNERFCGIHATAFHAEDFDIVADRGGSIVWSPLSNYLLYGATMDIAAAKNSGVLMGIGCDWAPSGSRNLLGEMKVAWLSSEEQGSVFTYEDIVRMATINGAKILKWDQVLGSIEPGKKADFVAINGQQGDEYEQLVMARETSVTLVVIDGVPRIGQKSIMKRFTIAEENLEEVQISSSSRYLYLEQEEADDLVEAVTYTEAEQRLKNALANLPQLAINYDTASNDGIFNGSVGRQHTRFRLMHDFEEEENPFIAAIPMSDFVTSPKELESPVAAGDSQFFRSLMDARNLPEFVKKGLPPLFGEPIPRAREGVVPEDSRIPEDVLESIRTLKSFLRTWGELTYQDRIVILEEAIQLLQEHYVHLPFKEAMHAVDPIQRLRLIRHRLQERGSIYQLPEIDFHNEIVRAFISLRDLHTTYMLPAPFSNKEAWLPFMIEEYIERGEQKYLISKVVGNVEGLEEGMEVTYWNGTPIKRFIDNFAREQAGGNEPARRARALNSLTIRPLVFGLPPDEEFVTLTLSDGEQVTLEWLIFEPTFSPFSVESSSGTAASVIGLDPKTDEIQQAKRLLYAGQVVESEKTTIEVVGENIHKIQLFESSTELIPTHLPTVFRAKVVETPSGSFGYVRIFTFNINSPQVFVDEFADIVTQLPSEGLIIDVRGNGGGHIWAAELLLQAISPRRIEPQKAQFINTPTNILLCENNSPSVRFADLDLSAWTPSMRESVETGSTYSLGFPITPVELLRERRQCYTGPIVLITDALCYSATDMFAAGFKDFELGTILGISGATGAGGANVWSHSLISDLLPGERQSLPHGADLTVSIRRILRSGSRTGQVLEDLGVKPDIVHDMTKDDLLHENRDLIAKAGEILAGSKIYSISDLTIDQRRIRGEAECLSRIDAVSGERVMQSVDVEEGRFLISVSQGITELRGYDGDTLVITQHIE